MSDLSHFLKTQTSSRLSPTIVVVVDGFCASRQDKQKYLHCEEKYKQDKVFLEVATSLAAQ